MPKLNPINIPAYQRKKSIAAKGRKKPTVRRRRTKKDNELTDIPIRPIMPSADRYRRTEDVRNSSREMKICGRCEGYFDRIDVAVIAVTSPLRPGDQIIFETTEGLFEQTLKSMQVDRKDVDMAGSGSEIGVKVSQEPKVGGLVYKVI